MREIYLAFGQGETQTSSHPTLVEKPQEPTQQPVPALRPIPTPLAQDSHKLSGGTQAAKRRLHHKRNLLTQVRSHRKGLNPQGQQGLADTKERARIKGRGNVTNEHKKSQLRNPVPNHVQ